MHRFLLLFLLASPALAGSNVELEHIMDTDDGAVYSIETSHGGPLAKLWRGESKKADTKQAAKSAKQLCRDQGFEAYRYATFKDRREDETLAAAWADFGASAEDGHRTTFELVFLTSERKPEPSAAWTLCWSAKELEKRDAAEEAAG